MITFSTFDENLGAKMDTNGQILPHLIKEAQANNGIEIRKWWQRLIREELVWNDNDFEYISDHEKEESNDRQVQNMIENYKSHLLQQQKLKSTAGSQQLRYV